MNKSRAASRRCSDHNASISQKRQIQECGHRQAEIVGAGIAHDMLFAHQLAFHRRNRRDKTRVVHLDHAQVGKQQNAGVEIVRSERRGEGAAFFVPGAFEQRRVDRLGDRIPVFGAVVQADALSDCREPLTAGPAHRHRVGMDALPAAIFPNAGVGLQRLFRRAVAERFQETKQSLVAGPRQAAIEEHRHGREDDAAIGIVLRLIDRGIADPYRTVAAIALKIGRGPFFDIVVGTTL